MTFLRMRRTMKSDSKPIMRNNPLDSVLKIPSERAEGRNGYNRPFNSAITKRRASVTFDIGIIKEEESELSSWKNEKDKGIIFRRMSAPELPPIQTSPSPMTIPRHRYLHSRSNNKSNTSENSQRSRPMKSPFSAGSSESNNSHGHHRVPNGLVGHRSKTWVPSDQTLTEITSQNTGSTNNLKLEAITNNTKKNGISVGTPRSVRNDYNRKRLSSKDNSMSSGNNNTASIRRTLKNSQSDSRIEPLENFTTNRQKILKKVNSENKFNRPNQKVLSIDKTDILTRNTRNAGTVNGMRRYASTVQLTPQKSTVDDDLLDYDSSSDSDKDQMIITWLIGVDTEDPEEPPEQEIFYPDEPPQTDTAVHIIYNGDS